MSVLISWVVGLFMPLFYSVSIESFLPASKSDMFTLTVSFTNVKKEWYGKKVYMAVWKKGTEGFPERGTQDKYSTFWVKSEKKSGSFELAKGTYAVSCYLDLNGNKRLDYNMWGAPMEPYCFSKNFKPSFSAPDFDDCDFYLSANKEIKLKLIY